MNFDPFPSCCSGVVPSSFSGQEKGAVGAPRQIAEISQTFSSETSGAAEGGHPENGRHHFRLVYNLFIEKRRAKILN